MDAHAIPHEFIFTDEAEFNLAKTIGHRDNIDVPGRRGGNITMCAAIFNTHGVLRRHANLGPYNTAHVLTFPDRLNDILIPPESMNDADHQNNWCVVVWDDMCFPRAIPPTILTISDPLDKFFSAWWWRV